MLQQWKRKTIIGVCGLGSKTDTKDIMRWLKKNGLFEKGIAVPTYSIGKNAICSDYWIFTKEMSLFELVRLYIWMQISYVGHLTNVYFIKNTGQNPKDYYKVKE